MEERLRGFALAPEAVLSAGDPGMGPPDDLKKSMNEARRDFCPTCTGCCCSSMLLLALRATEASGGSSCSTGLDLKKSMNEARRLFALIAAGIGSTSAAAVA